MGELGRLGAKGTAEFSPSFDLLKARGVDRVEEVALRPYEIERFGVPADAFLRCEGDRADKVVDLGGDLAMALMRELCDVG